MPHVRCARATAAFHNSPWKVSFLYPPRRPSEPQLLLLRSGLGENTCLETLNVCLF